MPYTKAEPAESIDDVVVKQERPVAPSSGGDNLHDDVSAPELPPFSGGEEIEDSHHAGIGPVPHDDEIVAAANITMHPSEGEGMGPGLFPPEAAGMEIAMPSHGGEGEELSHGMAPLPPDLAMGQAYAYPRNPLGMPEVIIPAKWLARFEEIKRFKYEKGHTNVPQKYDRNPQLGAWARTQKQQYKLLREGKPSHMSQARLDLLEEIGFEWVGEKRDKFWNDRYKELLEFHAIHQSTRIPNDFAQDPQLFSWVALQRRHLKLFREGPEKNGKRSSLTEERARLLEAVGLEYQIRNTCDWMERVEELRAYKKKFGNCDVPQKYRENPSLGRWVDNQKTQHKKMYEGKPTHLTIERIQVLVGLGFQWR